MMPNLIRADDSAAENEYLQLAQSHKYDSRLICVIAELRPGLFALYQFAEVLYVGHSWDELLDHYRTRAVWVPKARPAQTETRKRAGKISASQKSANTAALLAKLAATRGATP